MDKEFNVKVFDLGLAKPGLVGDKMNGSSRSARHALFLSRSLPYRRRHGRGRIRLVQCPRLPSSGACTRAEISVSLDGRRAIRFLPDVSTAIEEVARFGPPARVRRPVILHSRAGQWPFAALRSQNQTFLGSCQLDKLKKG
ncbi:hypothetical protein EJ110_NYTH52202 [Nymphaea thermarum]|nr:hypothetical protein EJ110_NYTH52202 [Nymphaea thermarum]